MPALPARVVILGGAALVAISYAFHAVSAVRTLITGIADADVPSAPPQV